MPLHSAKAGFRTVLRDYAGDHHENGGVDEASQESFPASDPGAAFADKTGDAPVDCSNVGDVGDRASQPDHGHPRRWQPSSCSTTAPSSSRPSPLAPTPPTRRSWSAPRCWQRRPSNAVSTRKPWVKTTLAPGSKVVVDYYERSGLTPYLDKLGFNLVGFGCTTCIGNSGPLFPEISAAVSEADLAVVSVLSGNRNFEGRINPDVKMNYLASPPLVVAYALAGTMDLDITTEPLGTGSDGKPVYLAELWPTEKEIADVIGDAIQSDMFTRDYAAVFAGDELWQGLPLGDSGPDAFSWDDASTYVRKPPYFEGMAREPAPRTDIEGARVLAMLGDSVTTDHISPASSIKKDSPAGRYLSEHGVDAKDFNSYGSRRGNHEVMIRGTFANIRLRNQLAPGTEGGVTRHLAGWRADVDLRRRAAVRRRRRAADGARRQGVRLRILPRLGRQGHRAARGAGGHRRVVRAHPPFQPDRYGRASAAVPGGRDAASRSASPARRSSPSAAWPTVTEQTPTVRVEAGDKSFDAVVRIDTPGEAEYFRHGGHPALRAALTAREVSDAPAASRDPAACRRSRSRLASEAGRAAGRRTAPACGWPPPSPRPPTW